ncbi:hypothetical protein [Mycolicibacterium fortuitum]|uniref:Uncharacterized protein n=1 Tax=Mycolicibacterium fortuitum TaxID=1766 RepID=A0AAE4VEI5_MYCFO|nr:hypothetical protein [Mycolicibacterium fortuitum]MDV7192627.1 hypothetical protein [Mycolicibacterium fortuitum]MDV7205528.1 hypothetical protein [Mycolicibacterium fortuitum]MDV7227109.1 hypothetical protein [Mycolicibacterium fortuitum]MDV7259646.1 hypothetical protein [Mycolicibacterium fortuitum]MDV7286209.1 hypothetical protein [Mycolicibacterium fortuitum]
MADMGIPPRMRAEIDQHEAQLRDLANTAMTTYREHVEQDHGGEPSHCAQSMLVIGYMGLRIDPETLAVTQCADTLPQPLAYGLIAYLVERLYLAQRDAGRAAAEILATTEELKALKARFEAGQ